MRTSSQFETARTVPQFERATTNLTKYIWDLYKHSLSLKTAQPAAVGGDKAMRGHWHVLLTHSWPVSPGASTSPNAIKSAPDMVTLCLPQLCDIAFLQLTHHNAWPWTILPTYNSAEQRKLVMKTGVKYDTWLLDTLTMFFRITYRVSILFKTL